MSDQADIKNATIIGLYNETDSEGYPYIGKILGKDLNHLSEWGIMLDHRGTLYYKDLHVFKLIPVNKKEFKKLVDSYIEKELKKEKAEKKVKLLAELKELEKDENEIYGV